MRLMPHTALECCTLNGARAMGLDATHGSIARDKRADIIVTRRLPDLSSIPYNYTAPYISRLILAGRPV